MRARSSLLEQPQPKPARKQLSSKKQLEKIKLTERMLELDREVQALRDRITELLEERSQLVKKVNALS